MFKEINVCVLKLNNITLQSTINAYSDFKLASKLDNNNDNTTNVTNTTASYNNYLSVVTSSFVNCWKFEMND